MTKTDIAKKIASTVVSVGTGTIAYRAISTNVPIESNVDKVTVTAASVVIADMAGNATASYTDARIDDAIAWWKANVRK